MKSLALAVVLLARSAHADCDPVSLRAQLTAEAIRMDHWRYGWSIAYGAATAAQLALVVGTYNPLGAHDRDYRDANLVGAAQSAIASVASLLAPRIDVPDPEADACADLIALRSARARAGTRERLLFWGGHVGNLVVNLAASAVLAADTTWSAAILAFAIGYPIGLLNTYTMPRDSWHATGVVAVPVS
ncbi:hypothetical protein BH11MYX1_BH11MYX1_20000 [soil metagenome]